MSAVLMVGIELHNPVCILVSVCENMPQLQTDKERKKRNQNHLQFKAFLDVMRTRTVAFTVTFYSQVLYTDAVTQPSLPPRL